MRKEASTSNKLRPELLEEVFELNESLDELREAKISRQRSGSAEGASRVSREKFRGETRRSRRPSFKPRPADWDAAVDSNADDAARRKLMSRMNELLNRRSYIRNLVVKRSKGTLLKPKKEL